MGCNRHGMALFAAIEGEHVPMIAEYIKSRRVVNEHSWLVGTKSTATELSGYIDFEATFNQGWGKSWTSVNQSSHHGFRFHLLVATNCAFQWSGRATFDPGWRRNHHCYKCWQAETSFYNKESLVGLPWPWPNLQLRLLKFENIVKQLRPTGWAFFQASRKIALDASACLCVG